MGNVLGVGISLHVLVLRPHDPAWCPKPARTHHCRAAPARAKPCISATRSSAPYDSALLPYSRWSCTAAMSAGWECCRRPRAATRRHTWGREGTHRSMCRWGEGVKDATYSVYR